MTSFRRWTKRRAIFTRWSTISPGTSRRECSIRIRTPTFCWTTDARSRWTASMSSASSSTTICVPSRRSLTVRKLKQETIRRYSTERSGWTCVYGFGSKLASDVGVSLSLRPAVEHGGPVGLSRGSSEKDMVEND